MYSNKSVVSLFKKMNKEEIEPPRYSTLERLEKHPLPGWNFTATSMKFLFSSSLYRIHSETFPVKSPQVGVAAARVPLKAPSSHSIAFKTLEKWESKTRMLVAVACHVDI